jgi:hypothetical protein
MMITATPTIEEEAAGKHTKEMAARRVTGIPPEHSVSQKHAWA